MGTFTCRPGDVVIKPANKRHRNSFSHLGAVCLLLEISEELFEHSPALVEAELKAPIRDDHLTRIGLELREELKSADSLSPIMLNAIALRGLVSGLRFVSKRSKRDAHVEAMREMLDAGVAAGDLSQRFLTARERKTARRLFYEMEGCSMSTYVLRRRAFRAFAEVLNTDHSLAEIAHHCRFYDQAYFTKAFTTLFGVTPGRLRSRTS
jgi:AraC-like DNA-binding protein